MSEKLHGRKRRLTEEDMGDFVRRARLEEILDIRSEEPNVSEICVGQALADVAGFKSLQNTGRLLFRSAMKDLFFYGRSIEERTLEKIDANNIRSHSTEIFLYRFNGIIYAWYINPWGYKYDDIYVQNLEKFRVKHFDSVPGNDDIFPNPTENALNGNPPSQHEMDGLWQEETDKIRRIRDIVGSTPQMNKHDKDQMSHGLVEYLFYAKLRSVATPGMVGYLARALQYGAHYGVLHAVLLLQQIYRRPDIKIVMPWQSMSENGPQARSDLSRKNDMICKHVNEKGEGLGDCAVWGRAYHVVAKSHLAHARTEIEIQNVIISDLREMFIMGEKSARHFSGKVMLSTPLGKALRPMSIVYKAIPIEKVQTVAGQTAFKVHVRKVYDRAIENIKSMEFDQSISSYQKQVYYVFVSFLDNIDSTESAKKQGSLNRILFRNVNADMNTQMMVAQFIREFPDQGIKRTCRLLIDVALIMISCIFSSEMFKDSGMYISPL